MGLQISSHTAAQSGVGDEGRQPAGTPGVVHRHDDPVFAVAHLAGRSRVGRNGHRPAQHLCLTYGHRLALVAGGLGVDVACRYVRVRVGALARSRTCSSIPAWAILSRMRASSPPYPIMYHRRPLIPWSCTSLRAISGTLS